jgi:hypothetical protein
MHAQRILPVYISATHTHYPVKRAVGYYALRGKCYSTTFCAVLVGCCPGENATPLDLEARGALVENVTTNLVGSSQSPLAQIRS